MAQVDIGDLAIEVRGQGEGPTVVLVHGSASDRRTWRPLAARLEDRCRLLSYSRRFHWPNPPAGDDAEYTMDAHVDDLVAIIEGSVDVPVNVIGHSYGGFMSLLLSIRRPDLVARQVLIEPPVVTLFLSDPPRPSEVLRVLATQPRLGLELLRFGATGLVPATKAAEKGDMDKAIHIFGPASLGRDAFDRLSPGRWEQVEANNIRAEYLSNSLAPVTAAEIRSVTTPTLLVSGSNSPRLWPMLADHLDTLLPNSTRVDIADASHIVQEDNPDGLAAAITGFLSPA